MAYIRKSHSNSLSFIFISFLCVFPEFTQIIANNLSCSPFIQQGQHIIRTFLYILYAHIKRTFFSLETYLGDLCSSTLGITLSFVCSIIYNIPFIDIIYNLFGSTLIDRHLSFSSSFLFLSLPPTLPLFYLLCSVCRSKQHMFSYILEMNLQNTFLEVGLLDEKAKVFVILVDVAKLFSASHT